MLCPRDDAEMKVHQHEAGFDVDSCPSCGGIWLDKGELEKVKAKVEGEVDEGSLVAPEDLDGAFSRRLQASYGLIDCPRCGVRMDTREYENWSQIVVDVCPKGCGLWLDKNELGALEAFFGKNAQDKSAMWSTLTDLFGG